MLRYIVGHRGASGYEPENTLRSFRRAFSDGANAVELDLRRSYDGQMIVIHDAKVDRTTNGRGMVEEMTLEELKGLDAGKGERIPTFEEVAVLVKQRKGTMFIEVKVPGIEEDLLSAIRRHEVQVNVVVFGLQGGGSPSPSIMRIHELEPKILCTIPGIVRIGIPDLSRENILKLHEDGLILVHGDIDDEAEMQRLIDLGLDGIITNFPNRLAKVACKYQRGMDDG